MLGQLEVRVEALESGIAVYFAFVVEDVGLTKIEGRSVFVTTRCLKPTPDRRSDIIVDCNLVSMQAIGCFAQKHSVAMTHLVDSCEDQTVFVHYAVHAEKLHRG